MIAQFRKELSSFFMDKLGKRGIIPILENDSGYLHYWGEMILERT